MLNSIKDRSKIDISYRLSNFLSQIVMQSHSTNKVRDSTKSMFSLQILQLLGNNSTNKSKKIYDDYAFDKLAPITIRKLTRTYLSVTM